MAEERWSSHEGFHNSGGIGVFEIGGDGALVMMQNLEGVLPASTFANGLLVH